MSASFLDVGFFVQLVITLIWSGTLLVLAGLAVLRLRTSASGLLFAGAFTVWALERLLVFVAANFIPPMLDDPSGYMALQALVIYGVGLLEILAIGGAFAMLPRSLGSLAAKE